MKKKIAFGGMICALCLLLFSCTSGIATDTEPPAPVTSAAVCLEDYSQGLFLRLNENETAWEVAGIGQCKDTVVRIPREFEGLPVTKIADNAFANDTENTPYTGFIIPDSVTVIGKGAFWGCDNLESIVVPDSVTAIGDNAFGCCYKLRSAVLPSGLTELAEYVFWRCNSLQDITLPDGVTTIGRCAFGECLMLIDVTLPKNIKTLGNSAFSYCNNLQKITVPAGLEELNMAIYSCPALTEINYQGSVSQWRQVRKTKGWDVDTGNFTVKCTDGTLKKGEA